jgi:hypothetical protein
MHLTRGALALAWIAVAASAAAQTVPSEPVRFGGGRVVLGGDVAAAYASDDPGFFDYGDYDHRTLRQVRLGLSARVRAGERLSVLAEVRSENFDTVSPFALYVHVRPWPGRRIDIQAGRIPPAFGRFSREAYGRQNPLIGYPLAYQYLTSLRADALPASPDELLQMRTRGWRPSFSVGSPELAPGVPMVSALRWDTGVQVTTGWNAVTVTGAVTSGTVSNPRVTDDNGGKQVTGRVTVAALPGLELGASFARGAFVSRAAARAAGVTDEAGFHQMAQGVDLEYGRGRFVGRAEALLSEWRVPMRSTGTTQRLRAAATSVEGRYTLLPGIYAAARVERLAFNRIGTSAGLLEWDVPVTRVEVGGGYYIQRNVVARSSVQVNRREAGRITRANLVSVQLLYWF